MLQLKNLSLQFGDRYLFREASADIRNRDRIGLVGPNGSGKTTLLRIINGEFSPDAGNVELASGATIGYLPQEGVVLRDRSLVEEMESAAGQIQEIQRRMEDAQEILKLHSPETEIYTEAVERLGHYGQMLENLEAHKLRHRVEKILFGLGFSNDDLARSCDELSGGWRMRVALGKLLLQEPDLLMMDEPTNHLDLPSLRWLEQFLQHYEGAVMVVSHDKRFLDKMTKRTLSLEQAKIVAYQGNYSFFEKERAARREQKIEAKKNQDRKIAETERFIERFRYKANKAAQVQSRIKQLEKIERIQIEQSQKNISFKFPECRPTGHEVISLQNISKSFGKLNLFENLNLTIHHGDRIGVVGRNGAGKSTLAAIISGREPCDSGQLKPGYHLKTGYFAQDQTRELDPEETTYEAAARVAENVRETTIRNVLGAFLFGELEIGKPVKILSGGEKNRLALARLLLCPSNFLVLDEPTNHLDMTSKDVLQQALQQYSGSYFIISHDRDFLEPLVNKVVELSPRQIRVFPGKLSDYLWKIEQEESAGDSNSKKESKSATNTPSQSSESPKERRKRAASLREQSKPLRNKIDKCEKRIAELEKMIAQREQAMADPAFFTRDEAAEETRIYHQWQEELSRLYESWELANDKLSAINKQNA